MLVTVTLGLIAFAMGGMGLVALLQPAALEKKVNTKEKSGRNTLKSIIGVLFLSCTALISTAFILKDSRLFLAVAVLMGIVGFCRLVGLYDNDSGKSLFTELLIALIMVGAHMKNIF